MEYRFNNEQSRKILILLIILIIMVSIIGGLIFYTGNNKLIVMQRIDKVANNASDSIFNLFDDYGKYNVVDLDFKANLDQNIESKVKSNEILNGTIHTNFSNVNEYKIINFNTNMQSNSSINGGLYEKDGYLYLKLNDSTYRINDDKIEDIDQYSNIQDIEELYKLIYTTAKKQLDQLDFYKIVVDGEKKQTKYGLSLTDERLKEIIKDTANALKENEKFINLYTKINSIEKDEVVENIDKYLKRLDEIEFSKDNTTKLEIYTSGILDFNTDKIEITRIENSILKFTTNITISENNINAIVEQNSKKTNISIVQNDNNKYNINIDNDYLNINITKDKNSIELKGSYNQHNFYMNHTIQKNEENKISKKGTISFNINKDSKITIVYNEIGQIEEKEESITLGEIKNINQLMSRFNLNNNLFNY